MKSTLTPEEEKEFKKWIDFAQEEYASTNIDFNNSKFEIAQK